MTYTQTEFQRAISTGKTKAKTEAEYRKIQPEKTVTASDRLHALLAYVAIGASKEWADELQRIEEAIRQEERDKVSEKVLAIANSGEFKGVAIGSECKGLLRNLPKELG